MKVICNRGVLLEALSMAGNVVSGRTPKPVLQCVRLVAQNNELTITATDLEVAVVFHDSQVEIEKPGEVVVPADKLRDIVRESVDETLSLELAGEILQVKGRDSVFKVFTQQADAFPPIPSFDEDSQFKIVGGQLKRMISQTIYAAAKEASRYAFNGILLSIKGSRVSFVGTDSRRLAQSLGDLTPGEKPMEKEGQLAIIPAKTLGLIEKLVSDPEELVGFKVTENQIMVKTSHAMLASTLIEGQYPPFEDVIPKNADKKMTAGTADFLSAVRRASLMTNEESKGLRLAFSATGLVISGQSPSAGEATVNFSCKFDGLDVTIGFNPGYLIEALKVVDSDEVMIELTDPKRPGVLKAGSNFLYVIMPVGLN